MPRSMTSSKNKCDTSASATTTQIPFSAGIVRSRRRRAWECIRIKRIRFDSSFKATTRRTSLQTANKLCRETPPLTNAHTRGKHTKLLGNPEHDFRDIATRKATDTCPPIATRSASKRRRSKRDTLVPSLYKRRIVQLCITEISDSVSKRAAFGAWFDRRHI